MRYELDANGYILSVFWGCNSGNCSEYTGTIPSGYKSLIDWSTDALINAYYINDEGNLTLDVDRLADLENKIEQETIDNAPVTQKELRKTSTVIEDEFVKNISGTRIIEIDNTGEYNIPKINLIGTNVSGDVQVVSSNKNLLKNDARTKEIDGITFTVNSNKTITLNGTATSDIEFDLSGNPTSTDMLFLIKENTEYITSGLSQGVSLSLFNFDGTDRTLLNSGGNEIINLSMPNVVTQATLNIASGTTFDEVTISPQIEKGTNSTSYETHKSSHFTTTINNNRATILNEINTYNPYTIIMIDKDMDMSVDYYEYQSLVTKFSELEITEEEIKSTVSEQNTKISQISQTVNEIKSEISDIADVTISADGYGSVHLEKISESEPIYIKINPTKNEDISYLYPRDNLFPSDDLFPKGRTLRFENDGYVIDYELPNDLLYYDENNYDEFILDYDTQTCEVNKKVGYNADGSKYLLETPQTTSYEYPSIPLPSGDYNVTMLGYDNAFMFVRMMVENIYTNQFATKVELNSSIIQTKDSITSEVSSKYATKDDLVTTQSTIKQTTDSINLEVSKKVNNSDYNSAQILLKINNDTSSTVIKSDKLDVDAIATFTNNKLANSGATVINGSNITTGTIDASEVEIKNLNANNITSGTISCDKLSGGTIKGQNISGGTVSGATITTGSYFSVNSSGIATLKNNVGFITLGRSGKHPWISGINVNGVNGIAFTTGTSSSSIGDEVGGIHVESGAMYINANGTVNINHNANGQVGGAVGICDYALSGHTFTGQGGAKMYANSNCAFQPADGYYAYVGSTSVSTNKIATSGVGPSSLNVKENLEEINTEDVYKDIQNLKLYNYDYKYKGITDRENDFGFIIDYVEELPTLSKYARHYNSKYYVDEDKKELAKIWDIEELDKTKEVLDVKEWDRDSYIKMSMVMIKALQNKIDTLENRIKVLEERE